MADVSMDYTSMAAMQTLAQTKHDALEDMLDTMDKLVEATEKKWRGHGHKKFVSSYSKIEADLRVVCECLEQYVSAIKQAQTAMEETDTNLARNINNGTLNAMSSLLALSNANNRSRVAIADEMKASDIGKSGKDTIIDNYRKNHGLEGKTEKYERYIHSSSDSGVVSILGTDFKYEKYTDYTGGSYEYVDGDSFYSVDTEFGKECQHIDFEATDGSGLSGDITMNGVKVYGDGELDLAKGNAYMKAGADYTVASITVGSESDLGGFSLTGEVGAGAHLDVGIHDGKFTIDAGAALGVGAGVKLEIDYEEMWDATKDAFGF